LFSGLCKSGKKILFKISALFYCSNFKQNEEMPVKQRKIPPATKLSAELSTDLVGALRVADRCATVQPN
jgi:hypothetical protein